MSGRIAVVWGGPSSESTISERSARNVFASLVKSHPDTVMTEFSEDLVRELRQDGIGRVFLVMHGNPGEDGSVQGLLELMKVPYTYSGVLTSALCLNKQRTKEILRANKLPVLPDFVVTRKNLSMSAALIAKRIGWPAVVKPNAEGSSVGVSFVRDPAECGSCLAEGVRLYGEMIVEPFAPGRELTVGVIEEAEQQLKPLPVMELKPKNAFYDYEAKYTAGMTDFLVPAPLPEGLTARIQEAAVRSGECLGCRSGFRVDMILDGTKFHILEVNTIPGMTETSDLPKAAEAEGIPFDSLVNRILATASLKRTGG